MTNPTVFVACKFRPEDTRSYTYTWDGDALAPGDLVKVADARADGWKRVIVVSVTDEAPPFQCKPILGRYEPDEVLEAPANETVSDMLVDLGSRDPLDAPNQF